VLHQYVAKCSYAQASAVELFYPAIPRDIAEEYELAEGESATRSPLNFGEAIIVLPGTEANDNQINRFF
jgi:hypothetical protein